MDDILLVLGQRCLPCLCPIRTREQGSFEPSDDQIAEPQRSQRLLRQAFSWPLGLWTNLWCINRFLRRVPRTHARTSSRPDTSSTRPPDSAPPDDLIEYLPTWLGDAPGSSRWKLRYSFILCILQLANAMVTGVLYATPFLLTTPGGMFLLGCQALSAAVAAVWAAASTANDFLDGVEKCICYVCECVAISLVLAATYISQGVYTHGRTRPPASPHTS